MRLNLRTSLSEANSRNNKNNVKNCESCDRALEKQTILTTKERIENWKISLALLLVSTEDQLKEAQNKFLGELHEVQD